MILQLDPPLPVSIPQGKGFAHFLLDYGIEQHLMWITVLDDTGEIWTVSNPDVRVRPNATINAPRRPKG